MTLDSLAASFASMQASMQAIIQQLAAQHAPAPPAAMPLLPRIPLPPSPASATPELVHPPAPHRAAVLDRAAVASQSDIAALVNRLSALRHDGDSDDEDDAQVPSHPHTHTRTTPAPPAPQQGVLPSAFIPSPVGTEQTATQQLAAIFTAINKQGTKVKYSSLEELDEALDDWATDAAKSGRTAQQVESIRAYQQLLVTQFAISERMPLKQVLEYHRLWCKAVHAGTIDMFALDAAWNAKIYHTVTHPRRLHCTGPFTPPSHQRDTKAKTTADKAPTPRKPAAATHPAGSCTYHPSSTSHTTAECQKKDSK